MKHDKSLQNFSYVTIANVIGTALQGLFYFIFALLLKPEEYGTMSYVIALAGTVSVISRFGLPFTSVVYQSKRNYTISNQTNVLTIITTTTASIILLFYDVLAGLLCLALSYFVINLEYLLGQRSYNKYFLIYILKSISLILLPILLYFPLQVPGIVLGMTISNFLGSPNFFKTLSFKVNSFKEIKKIYKVVIHNFTVDSSANLTRTIDKLVIVPFFGLTATAIYQFNLQIMLLASILPLSLYSFLLPEESRGASHRKINYIILSSSILFSILVIVVSPYIINNFFPKFSDGIPSLQIMIISIIPIAITSILNAKLQALESTTVGYAAILKIVSLIIMIIIIGEQYGLIGFSIAVVISACLETMFLFIIFKKIKY